MSPVILSQRSVFLLNQLSNAVYQQSARRFRLTEHTSIRELLDFSAQLSDGRVAKCHESFMQSLGQKQIQQLVAHNALPTEQAPLRVVS